MQRVTQGMLNAQLLRNLNANLYKMDNLQMQLATGRKINKPSDDPVGISFSMRYRSELSANDQYERNVDSANSWLDYTDTMLGQAGDVLQRVRELTVRAANDTNPQSALDSIQSEIDQLYEQLVEIGNSQFNGKYVFNGQLTDQAPYSIENAPNMSTDTVDIRFEISPGVKIPVGAKGNEIFGSPDDGDNAFQVIKDISNALREGKTSEASDLIAKIDTRMEKFLEVRSDVGARSNRLELASNRLSDINVNLQTLQTKTEDADMAEVYTNLKMAESVYQSSLSAGSRLIQPSLVDFLR